MIREEGLECSAQRYSMDGWMLRGEGSGNCFDNQCWGVLGKVTCEFPMIDWVFLPFALASCWSRSVSVSITIRG
jgi:hypothetical protein